MLTILGNLGGALMGFLRSTISLVPMGIAFLLGGKRAQMKEAEHNAEVKDEQLEIASRPSRHRNQLLKRMRKRRRSNT